jgi:hypothetical protein
MSMNATDEAFRSASATRCATVDFPDPDPPAMPMTSGRCAGADLAGMSAVDVAEYVIKREARELSRSGIAMPEATAAGRSLRVRLKVVALAAPPSTPRLATPAAGMAGRVAPSGSGEGWGEAQGGAHVPPRTRAR